MQDDIDEEQALLNKRLAADKLRPNPCRCGHSQEAHDSGYAFCWFCDCKEYARDEFKAAR
jgi:hypothetical protein